MRFIILVVLLSCDGCCAGAMAFEQVSGLAKVALGVICKSISVGFHQQLSFVSIPSATHLSNVFIEDVFHALRLLHSLLLLALWSMAHVSS